MKKILLLIIFSSTISTVNAACPITGGACSSDLELPSLENNLVPENLQNMQKPDAFQENPIQSYEIKTITPDQATSTPRANDYNADCQFGVCLPGGF